MIPFVDLKKQYDQLKEEIDSAIFESINSSDFIGGESVLGFEKNFATKNNSKFCIGAANGTETLQIALRTIGIGPGDEVIVPVNSWISSSEVINLIKAKPVFCDIEPKTFNICVEDLKRKITKKTKCIIAVHLYGHPCDIENILEIANSEKIFVIEDCAQSHFSSYKNKFVGNFGVFGSFSFYPGKNLGAFGDSGALVTNNEEFAKTAKMITQHGSLVKHEHEIIGTNARLDAIQAKILNLKLKKIDEWNE